MSAKGSPIRQVRINEEMWARMQQAAADEGARRGKTYSVSELIRDAIEALLSPPTGSQ